jgi:hypothetical protein
MIRTVAPRQKVNNRESNLPRANERERICSRDSVYIASNRRISHFEAAPNKGSINAADRGFAAATHDTKWLSLFLRIFG